MEYKFIISETEADLIDDLERLSVISYENILAMIDKEYVLCCPQCISLKGSWRERKRLTPKFVCSLCKHQFDLPTQRLMYVQPKVIDNEELAVNSHIAFLSRVIIARLERLQALKYSAEYESLLDKLGLNKLRTPGQN